MKLSQARKQALALEEVTEEPHHDYSSSRFRGKIVITVPPDGEHIHVFVLGVKQDEAVALYPTFIEKLFWGSKALGVRVNLALAAPAVVRNLVALAYETRVAKDAGQEARGCFQVAVSAQVTRAAGPNTSVNARPNGLAPGPRSRVVHHRFRGPGANPSVPRYLER